MTITCMLTVTFDSLIDLWTRVLDNKTIQLTLIMSQQFPGVYNALKQKFQIDLTVDNNILENNHELRIIANNCIFYCNCDIVTEIGLF